MSKATVAPNMEILVPGGGSRLQPLTQANVDAVKDGKSIFYVYGEVRYVDAFGKDRKTQFSYAFNELTGGVREGRLMAAADGNDAD